MPNNNKKPSKISSYFKENTSKTAVIIVLVIAFCTLIFGLWIYAVTFFVPKSPQAKDLSQKPLNINIQQYQKVITQMQDEQKTTVPKINKDPFAE